MKTTHRITLNIGLVTYNRKDTITTAQAVEACNHAGIKLLPPTECKQSETEVTLCSVAEYDGDDCIHATIYNLALVLQQGCIAWIDGGGIGHLTGPQAAQWGNFNRAYFLFPKKAFDVTGFCIAWENGDLSEPDVIDGFQELIDSGLAWQLQGCYGRTAQALINAGHCKLNK